MASSAVTVTLLRSFIYSASQAAIDWFGGSAGMKISLTKVHKHATRSRHSPIRSNLTNEHNVHWMRAAIGKVNWKTEFAFKIGRAHV